MRKIFFDDKYGLTQAVLEGRKTMTRRLVPIKEAQRLDSFFDSDDWDYATQTCIDDSATYMIGEVVAVAQQYKVLDYGFHGFATNQSRSCGIRKEYAEKQKGWGNKMFVESKFMPHQIRITDIKVERLQDISFDSALKEGLVWEHKAQKFCVIKKRLSNGMCVREWLGTKYKEAFAALFDWISGKGTWERNPYVFVYSFELVKKARRASNERP